MFEGRLPRKGEARPLGETGEEGEFLRELTWADLVARLGVSRSRSEAAGQEPEGVDASFDAMSARRIAAHHDGKNAVNHDGSSYGKETGRSGERTGPERMKGAGSGYAPGLRGSK